MQSIAKGIAEGLAAAWSSGDVEKIAAYFTRDCLFEDVCSGAAYRGQEALKGQARAAFVAVPVLKLHIQSVFSVGHWIGCEWVETGTQGGKRFSLRGASIVELEEARISRESIYCHFDGATWLDVRRPA